MNAQELRKQVEKYRQEALSAADKYMSRHVGIKIEQGAEMLKTKCVVNISDSPSNQEKIIISQ